MDVIKAVAMLHCLFVLRLAFVFNGGLYYSGFGGIDFLLFLVVFGIFVSVGIIIFELG